MGDCFQTIVDETVTELEAPTLGARVLAWLVAEEIVQSEPSNSGYGSGHSYSPGNNCRQACDMTMPNSETQFLSFQRLRCNGLSIIAERTVFHAGQCELTLICANCAVHLEDDNIGENWRGAIGGWYTSYGDALFACPSCGAIRPVTTWIYDPPWGFGCLGFEFWNWPSLNTTFIVDVERILEHPIKLVAGKL